MRGTSDESGQAIVFVALSVAMLLGFAALAADVGSLFYSKREMQTAADAAAIAGASELSYQNSGDTGDVTAAAEEDASQNGFTSGVTVNSPPLYGPNAGNAAYVEVIISQAETSPFLGYWGWSPMTVTARAVATNSPGQGCVYTLGTNSTDISITGNADISAPKCGIIDDSTNGCAIDLTGNITLNAASIGVAGNTCETGNITVTPTPVTGIVPSGNPLDYLPTPTVPPGCTTAINLSGNNSATFSQGCYTELEATGNSVLTLEPGTYIIDGPIEITGNASVTGTGVTLILLGSSSGSNGITGNVTLDLTAPTSGTYDGILIYQPASNQEPFSLVGNSSSTLEGIIDAPGAAVSMTGNSGSTIYTDFVVSTLTLVGNASFQDYAQLNGTVLNVPRLVE